MDKKVINKTVIYEGLFLDLSLDYDECYYNPLTKLDDYSLECPINHRHVTVTYKPETIHSKYYGRRFYVILKGYGNDGKNEGYKVDIIANREDCSKEYIEESNRLVANIKNPHITISVSSDGRPVDTGNLEFRALSIAEQEVLRFRFGACVLFEYSDGTKEVDHITSEYDLNNR